MVEFEIDSQNYRAGKLNAFQQLHVSRKIAPVIPKLLPGFMKIAEGDKDLASMASALEPATQALSEMSEADCEYVYGMCLSVVSRQQGNSWSSVWSTSNKTLLFDDINLGTMTQIVFKVVQDSLGNFIAGLLTKAQASSPEAAAA